MIGYRYVLLASFAAASLMYARPVLAQAFDIEDIQVFESEESLEVILQTPTEGTLNPSVSRSGSTTVIDIPNAQLQLAEGERFLRESPAQNITSISVTELDADTVRIVVSGAIAAPEVRVSRTDAAVIISVPGEDDAIEAAEGEPAIAEDATAAETPSSGATDRTLEDAEFTLGEITVEGRRLKFFVPEASTATRTDTLIENTPLSIQVIPREAITEQGATRLTDVLENTSGVTTGNVSDGSDQYRIRGFDVGTIARDGYRESLFLERSSPRDTANIEQVEVLRGPAAILFGSLDAGGTINLITKQPEFTPFLDLSVTAGSFSTYRSEIDFNYPISEDGDLRARINAAYEDSGSFRDFTTIERIFVAPTLVWDISDRARLNLSGEYLLDNRPFDRGLVALGDAIADIPFSRRLGNPFDELVSEEFRLGYQFEYDFSDRWQLRNGVAYTRNDRSRINTQPSGFDEETGILSRRIFETDPDYLETFVVRGEVAGEFDTGETVSHQLVMGVEWIQQRRFATVLLGGAPGIDVFNPVYQDADELLGDNAFGLPIIDSSTRAQNLGFYAQNTTDINDTVFILAGGRLEFINDKNDDFLFGTNQNFDTTEFIPQIGVVYKPSESVSLYSSYSESFRSNTLALASNREILEPEESRQFEIGVKADLFNDNILATLAAFDVRRENELAPDPENPGFVVPIGETQSRGIELNLTGEILPGWDIIASYAYTDTEILRDSEETEGNRFDNVPLHSGRIWTTYEIQEGNLEGLAFGVGFTAVSEREGDTRNTFQLDPYAIFDAAIFYRKNDLNLALNFNNIFDVRYISSAGTRTSVTPGAPFEVRGTLTWSF